MIDEIFLLIYHFGLSYEQAIALSEAERNLYFNILWKKKMEVEYPTKSRYKLDSKNFTDLHGYVITAQEDHFTKSIYVTVLDAIVNGKPVVYNWISNTLRSPGEEVLTLTFHNDNGDVLYKKNFTGIRLMGHRSNHDYSCDHDDLQDHELKFEYKDLEVSHNLDRN